MLVRTIRCLLLTAGVLLVCGAERAEAQFGVPYAFGGYGSSIYANERLPFYSLYPPVYYKRPVPRSYGYSPFAYPLGSPTPPPVTVTGQIVQNPYCPAPVGTMEPDSATVSARRPAALVIRNPYVSEADAPKPESVSSAELRN